MADGRTHTAEEIAEKVAGIHKILINAGVQKHPDTLATSFNIMLMDGDFMKDVYRNKPPQQQSVLIP